MDNNINKVKAKYILAFIVLLPALLLTFGQGKKVLVQPQFYNILTTDSTPPAPASKPLVFKRFNIVDSTDSTGPVTVIDTNALSPKVDTFNYRISKDSLDGPVAYHADDSMVMDVPGKKITLYGKQSNTKYQDNDLTAPTIQFDQSTSLITASLTRDSTGKVISFPTFVQGDMTTVSDTIAFNMKTGKGLTKGTYTHQDEMFIYADRIKKVNNEEFFAYKARITTCNLDTPHFAFVSKKMKFINKKFAVSGPVHPEFEGVPLPIILPFGIYPLSMGRHSGLLPPTFTATQQFGLALQNLGYYKVINDNWDVTTRGTIYSYGGYAFNITPNYFRRYHYRGALSFDYQRTKLNFKGDPDYSVGKTFLVRWSHSADTKARPGVTFSANVTAGSNKFNVSVPNSNVRNYTNQLSSSIAYAKNWGPYNISLNANHSQNSVNGSISVTLPDVSFNLNTLYPFRRKEPVGTLKWYENIGIALNSNAKSLTTFTDDTARSKLNIGKQIFNNLQWGANHNVPITLSLPQIGPVTISPGISYAERWYQNKSIETWNIRDKRLDTSIKKGFYTARDMSFSLSLSTRIFGSFGFKKTSRVQAIRHEIRPSMSISYKPDFNSNFYYTTQYDTAGRFKRSSYFSNSLYGPFSEGKFGGIGFSIDNNIQMKVRSKTDTSEAGLKKVTLIDGLSVNGSYNFLLDSFQLSVLSLGARTNLFDKINITASAIVDPYRSDPLSGRRLNTLVWRDKLISLGRITGGNVSMSTSFQGGGDKSAKVKSPTAVNLLTNPNNGMPLDEYETEAAYINSNPAEFADFSVPWSLSLQYSLRFSSGRNATNTDFSTTFFQDLNWNTTLALAPKWQLGINGFYNISQKQLGTISLNISREMHCWQMSINVSPVGRSRYFNFTISPKSALLRDIKVNRTRQFYDL